MVLLEYDFTVLDYILSGEPWGTVSYRFYGIVPPVKPIRVCYINTKIGADMIVSRIWLNDKE